MLSRDFNTLITIRARSLFLIWGVIMLAPVMYVLVAWFLFGQADDSNSFASTGLPLNQIGMGLIVILGIVATYFQRVALGGTRLKMVLDREPVVPGGKEKELFEKLPPAEKHLVGLWSHYQTTMIVVWALLETIAVVGLVLSIMQRDFQIVIPFAAAAVLLMVLKRPRPAEFIEGIRI